MYYIKINNDFQYKFHKKLKIYLLNAQKFSYNGIKDKKVGDMMDYKYIIFSSKLLLTKELFSVIQSLKDKNFAINFLDKDTNIKTHLSLDYAKENSLFVGVDEEDKRFAQKQNLAFGLAIWQCDAQKHIRAKYYFRQPYDILNLITSIQDPYANMKWLTTAMEMQFIAQAGLAYTVNDFDRERFARLSEMAAEIMSEYTNLPKKKVQNLFCNETGYQTPKLDTRSVIIKNNKILLVKERDGRWSLPGGWVDVNQSICDNLVKEAKEEAGLDVVPTRLVAIHDRNRHNVPLYAYGITKIFMLCDVLSGKFEQNIETSDSKYFALDELPELSLGKNTAEQIELCFAAAKDPNWIPVID